MMPADLSARTTETRTMTLLYTGTYTEPPLGRAQGIGIYDYGLATGEIGGHRAVTGVANPSFLAAAEGGEFLYAVGEGDGGTIVAFRRDPATGDLVEINRQSTGGGGPCYVSVDATGRYALVANYGSGSVAALPIGADGALGEATSVVQHEGSGPFEGRQEGPHAHMIAPTPDGRFVLATDLGADEVITYRLDEGSGQLERVSAMTTAPGAGPRHFAFAPNGRTVYVINELDNTLLTCDYDPETGTLETRQAISTLPEGYDEESYCAHVLVSPDGRFVYGSNRGHDSIAAFVVSGDDGEVDLIGLAPTRGSFPRHFALDPDGSRLLVANQNSDNLAILARDPETGLLSEENVVEGVPSTVCLLFVGE
jgi:6-phosphogluconolactonase